MFRLRQKHSKRRIGKQPPADAEKLLQAQSVTSALIAAAGTVIAVNIGWLWLAEASGKIFPWLTVAQGALVGIAVQRIGRGLDGRFVAIAVVAAFVGSFTGGLLVALSTTELELDAGAMSIIGGLTVMTWETYFAEVINPVDYIYAFSAASVAAFFAKRRLKRHEEFALRTMHKG